MTDDKELLTLFNCSTINTSPLVSGEITAVYQRLPKHITLKGKTEETMKKILLTPFLFLLLVGTLLVGTIKAEGEDPIINKSWRTIQQIFPDGNIIRFDASVPSKTQEELLYFLENNYQKPCIIRGVKTRVADDDFEVTGISIIVFGDESALDHYMKTLGSRDEFPVRPFRVSVPHGSIAWILIRQGSIEDFKLF